MLASVAAFVDNASLVKLKGVSRRSVAFGGVLLAVLALVPFALAGGDRTVESHKFTATPGSTTTDLVKCKEGSQLSGGGHSITPVAGNENSSRVKSLFPVGSRKWYVTLDSFHAADRAAESFVICRKGNKLESVSKDEPIDGEVDQFPDVTAKCPRGTSVTGGGGATTGGHGDVYMLESRPKGERGWYVKTFVSFSHVGEQEAFAICDHDKGNKYETAKETDTAIDLRRSKRGTVSQVTAEAKCPKGSETSGGGYATSEMQDPNQSVIDNRPDGKRTWLGRVRTYNPQNGFTAYARCLLG